MSTALDHRPWYAACSTRGVPSLLRRLGGRDAIEVVVVGLWERITRDPVLAPLFRDVSSPQYQRRLADYLCTLLGDRPDTWRGRDLRGVHADLAIRHDELDRFVGHLAETLDAASVAAELIAEVGARVETVRSLIVTADEERRA